MLETKLTETILTILLEQSSEKAVSSLSRDNSDHLGTFRKDCLKMLSVWETT